jgi:hypothetical protein
LRFNNFMGSEAVVGVEVGVGVEAWGHVDVVDVWD